MAALVILLIVAGCVAFEFLKGTCVKAFANLIAVVCSVATAFGFFEVLGNVIIARLDVRDNAAVISWVMPLCFLIIAALVFAIFETIIIQIMKKPVDFGDLPEKIGRCCFGLITGLVTAGAVLTVVAMMPLPSQYPYPRFDKNNPDVQNPSKVLLNIDGFTTGWANMMSKGSFSSGKSLAFMHANFLDTAFITRSTDDEIFDFTSKSVLEIPRKKAVWSAPENLKDTEENDLTAKTGNSFVIVRMGIKKSILSETKRFTASQVRLIGKSDLDSTPAPQGKGRTFFPAGYMENSEQAKVVKLYEAIIIDAAKIPGKTKWIDFLFEIPRDYKPEMIQFKQNNAAMLPAMTATEQAPEIISFSEPKKLEESSDTENATAEE